MMITFVLTFIFYIIVNLKNERALVLINNKKIIILSFIIFLSTWLIYSTDFVDIHQPFNEELSKTYDYGSAYNIPKYVDIYQPFNDDVRGNYGQESVNNINGYLDINQPFNGELNKTYHNGSSHNFHRVSNHGIVNLVSIGNLLTFIKLFSNLIDYLLVSRPSSRIELF